MTWRAQLRYAELTIFQELTNLFQYTTKLLKMTKTCLISSDKNFISIYIKETSDWMLFLKELCKQIFEQ